MEPLRFCFGLGHAMVCWVGITYAGAYFTGNHGLATALFCILGFVAGMYSMIRILEDD
jgi:hypothetical protein